MTEKINSFWSEVWKYRLMNMVIVSFSTTVKQMVEMFQWTKCLSKKCMKYLSEKNLGIIDCKTFGDI